MNSRTVVFALLVVGLLLLPAPLYLPAAANATAPPPKSSQVYSAEPVDLNTSSDREMLVDRHWTRVAFSAHQVSERYSHGEYRAPNESRSALREAMRNGSASVETAEAKADVRELASEYRFVTDTYSGIEGYYRLRVSANGATVEAEQVPMDRLAEAIADRAPRYEQLNASEQETLDRLLTNSSADTSGYRPQIDRPFADRLPTPFWKNGTLYSVSIIAHVDDLGPGFAAFFRGLIAAGVGLVLVAVTGGYLFFTRDR